MELTRSTDGFDVPLEARHVTSKDGTPIAAFRIGKGRTTWVLPPSMGGPLLSIKTLASHLSDRCTIVTWDMRGFFASGAPEDRDAYRIEHHLEDMEAVVDAFGVRDRFVLGGWSMGVQLSLEAMHLRPERVRGLILIAGPYGRALRSVVPLVSDRFARGLEHAAWRVGPTVTRAVRAALTREWLPPFAARFGLLARPDLMPEVISRFREVDWGRYLTVVRHLHEHSAEAYLSEVRTPTLIACGTRDILTPLETAREMHERIPGSELFVVPRATHYIPVEFGDLLASRIARFLDKHAL